MTTEKKNRNETALSINVTPGGLMAPQNVEQALEIAKMIAHSGMVPKHYTGNPGACLIAMQMGAELGLQPLAALQNIAVINGRPSLWGDAMLGLVTAHPLCEDVVETMSEDDAVATCRVKRKGRSIIERTFSRDDAKQAGLLGKAGPWTQYPKRMLQMRARGFALRDAFPDLLRGIMPAEEARDIVTLEPDYSPLTEGIHSTRKGAQDKPPAQATKPPEKPPESSEPPHELDLNAGEAELLGMVSKAESHDDIDLLIKEVDRRKPRKASTKVIMAAIKERSDEIKKAAPQTEVDF